jgi:hypothetical protein
MMNDRVRAAIIALAQSTFPVLMVLGVVELTDVQQGAIMLFVTNLITLVALLFPQGQQAG